MDSWQPYGVSMIYDAVSWLPDLSRTSFSTTVLLVTDGADNASVIEAETSGKIARRAAVPVYVLSLGPRRDRGVSSFSLDRHLLAALARATGGRLYEIRREEDVDQMCSDLLGRMRSQYLLGIATSGEGAVGDHTLEVVLRKKKLDIWYRRGYRGFDPLEINHDGRKK